MFDLNHIHAQNLIPKMARQLHFSHSGNEFQVGATGAGLTLFVCAMALFMCASHSRKWHHWRACYEPDTDEADHRHVIHHIQHGIRNEQNADIIDDEEVSVWQKNILMGGKCQLPDFSGVIIYDSDGSVVTPAKTPRLLLPWK